jgi:iron complex transport system ATP-binding protein
MSGVVFSVREIVETGRYPYLSRLLKMTKNDNEIVEKALFQVGCHDLAEKKITEISDGQYQKVMTARALAQDTPLCLLDEATAHLDILNRYEISFLLKKIAQESQKSILISTHDLETSFETADEIWLINEYGKIVVGSPEDLVLSGDFLHFFDKKRLIFNAENGTFLPASAPAMRHYFRLAGERTATFWLGKALRKNQFGTSETASDVIFAQKIEKNYIFSLNEEKKFNKVSDLLNFLVSAHSR